MTVLGNGFQGAQQSFNNVAYMPLATNVAATNVVIPSSGQVLCRWGAAFSNFSSVNDNTSFLGIAVSGGSTIAASDAKALTIELPAIPQTGDVQAVATGEITISGLTGTCTFTVQARGEAIVASVWITVYSA